MVEKSTKTRDRQKEDLSSYWQTHVQKWQSSKLTQAEYCHRHNLKYHQFHYWKKRFFKQNYSEKIKENLCNKDGLEFVELNAHRKAEINSRQASTGMYLSERALRFWVNGFCVEVENNFSPDSLSHLVRVLRTL